MAGASPLRLISVSMQHVYSYLYYIYTYYITISCFDWSMFVRVYIYTYVNCLQDLGQVFPSKPRIFDRVVWTCNDLHLTIQPWVWRSLSRYGWFIIINWFNWFSFTKKLRTAELHWKHLFHFQIHLDLIWWEEMQPYTAPHKRVSHGNLLFDFERVPSSNQPPKLQRLREKDLYLALEAVEAWTDPSLRRTATRLGGDGDGVWWAQWRRRTARSALSMHRKSIDLYSTRE